MANKLLSAFSEYDGGKESSPLIFSGLLGLPIDGNLTVQVPNRLGYVFVRIRDTQNEWVAAYNNAVSPVYNLPVLIQRQGNRWRVVDRDIERYEDWGTNLPFLPQHGDQHSFNRAGGGGDVTWIYADQFVPLLAFPSGTTGGPNVTFDGYLLQRDSDFIFVGHTGSPNLVQYKPTNNQAAVGLIYLDRRNGSFGVLMNTGTPFSANITGTAGIAPYIPYPASYQEPLYAVRLVSGTQTIQWENLYNARQFYSGRATGTGGGGTPISSGTYVPGTLTPNRIIATSSVGQVNTDDHLYFDEDGNVMIVGANSVPVPGKNAVHVVGSGSGPTIAGWSYESGTSATAGMTFFGGFRARGDASNPSGIFKDTGLVRLMGRGHDGVSWSNTQAQVLLTADEDWSSSQHGAGVGIYATPTGTTSMRKVAHFYGDGNLNLLASGTYNRNGVPHTHGMIFGSHGLRATIATGATQSLAHFVSGLTTLNSVIPKSGTVQNMYLAIASTQPATGSLVATLMINGTATAIVITIAAGSGIGTYTDLTNTVQYNAGDSIRLDIKNNAAASSAEVGFWAFEFVPD